MCEIINGYHGTKKIYAKLIVNAKNYLISGTFKDWLGKGIYFFQNDLHQAYMLSKFRNRLDHEDISVVYSEICSSQMIDLLIDDDRMFIEEYARSLKEKIIEEENIIGAWEHKEGYVLDYLYKEEPYDLVRAAYSVPSRETPPPLEYATIHIQVCVKNKECINKSSIKEVDCDAYC